MTINIGDQVRLKSGGPVMTVNTIEQVDGVGVESEKEREVIGCKWFNEKKCAKSGFFDSRCLDLDENLEDN